MSYCRFSDGDVYLVRNHDTLWSCFSCNLEKGEKTVYLDSLVEVREHLLKHEEAGHEISPDAFSRVNNELEEMFKMDPSSKNIEDAISIFCSKESFYTLDFLFVLPSELWESKLLEGLAGFDFSSYWTSINTDVITENIGRFQDKGKLKQILMSWEKVLEGEVGGEKDAGRKIDYNSLSNQQKHLYAITGAHFPGEMLKDIRKAIESIA